TESAKPGGGERGGSGAARRTRIERGARSGQWCSRGRAQLFQELPPAFSMIDVELARDLVECSLGVGRNGIRTVQRSSGAAGDPFRVRKQRRELTEIDFEVVPGRRQ